MKTRVLGRPLNRIEGRSKVTGSALYAADTATQACVHAYGIRSEIASGRIRSIDTSRAEGAAGVLMVLQAMDAPKFFRCPDDMQVGERRPPLQDDEVNYAGQYVAVVIAETFEQARWASRLVSVEYEASDELQIDFEQALQDADREESESRERGSPSDAYNHAEVQIDATYRTPVEVHNAMELHASVAWWELDRLVVEDSTQWVVGQGRALAKTFGIPEDRVEVRSRFIGSGFGSKLFLWPHTILACEAARRLRRPVKFVLDRQSQFTTAGHRPFTWQRVRLGADPSGRLRSLQHDAVNHTSFVHHYEESCTQQSWSLYSCAHVRTKEETLKLHSGSPTPMRGPGETPGMWALESALSELAVKLTIDPLELRLRNLPEKDEGRDLPWSSHTHERCLKQACERFGWEKRSAEVGSMREGTEIVGYGLASATWPGMRLEAKVQVEFTADGKARVDCATQDIGTGTYTVFGQVVSELTGLSFDDIDVRIGCSALPQGPISGGSMATATVVPAIAEATDKALDNLFQLAASPQGPFSGRKPEEFRMIDGCVQDGAGQRVKIGELLRQVGRQSIAGEAHAQPGDEQDRSSMRSFGAHCVEVRWDPLICKLRVARITSVIDAGRIINSKTAGNQVYGAIIMGLGMALLEESVYDRRSGRVVTDNIADYLMPVHAGTPEMDLTLLDEPDPQIGRFGARGIGEIGLTGVAPAVAEAVYHATGKRVRELPITVEKLIG